MSIRSSGLFLIQIHCSDSKPRRGFGENKIKTNRAAANDKDKGLVSQQLQSRGSTTKQSRPVSTQAPRLSSQVDGNSRDNSLDVDFEERLKAVRRSALEQKKAEEEKGFGAIDYDTPISSDKKAIGIGTKIGVGVAVVVFGLVFTFGDFLPSGSVSPNEDSAVVNSKLSEEDKATLQSRLKEFEGTLSNSPRDPTALEGAAVTLAELGEYARAASLLDDLTKEKPNNADAFRLLGEVKYELKDYEGSVAAYKSSAMVSDNIKFEVLHGLTNSLLAAKKPDEAVQFLLACRERLSSENLSKKSDSSPTDSQKLDPVQDQIPSFSCMKSMFERGEEQLYKAQRGKFFNELIAVELLLGKVYSDWGHVSDAVAVYDQLISTHPNDFRGYLAKGIILKENKNIGDAERMFIQARFFAPAKAKALVDRYSR